MNKETLAIINKMFYFERADAEANLNYANDLIRQAELSSKEVNEMQLKAVEQKREYLEKLSKCYNDFKKYVKESQKEEERK